MHEAKTKPGLAGAAPEQSDPVIEGSGPASPACAHLLDATRPRFELTPHGESAGEWRRPDAAVVAQAAPPPPARRNVRVVAGTTVAALAVVGAIGLLLRGRDVGRDAVVADGRAGSPRVAEPAAPAIAEAAPEPPAPGAPSPTTIEVRAGDTLWGLAGRHLGDPSRWPTLHELNRDRVPDPHLIYPGQELRVPTV